MMTTKFRTRSCGNMFGHGDLSILSVLEDTRDVQKYATSVLLWTLFPFQLLQSQLPQAQTILIEHVVVVLETNLPPPNSWQSLC